MAEPGAASGTARMPRRPRTSMRAKVTILTTVVVLLVGAWSAAWVLIRNAVADTMDEVLADLADDGVVATCGSRSIGGYPFRLEVTCASPSARLADGTILTLARLEAVGLVYNPRLAILGAEGPLTVSTPMGGVVNAEWSSLEASIRFSWPDWERVSVASDGLSVMTNLVEGTDRLTADHAEYHIRPLADPAGRQQYESVVFVDGGRAELAGASLSYLPADLMLMALLTNAEPLGSPSREAVEAWRAGGGQLTVPRARLAFGDAVFTGSGAAVLDETGRPDGSFAVEGTRPGAQRLTEAALAEQAVPYWLRTLAAALLALGRGVDGQPGALGLTVELGGGEARVGPFDLGELPVLVAPVDNPAPAPAPAVLPAPPAPPTA